MKTPSFITKMALVALFAGILVQSAVASAFIEKHFSGPNTEHRHIRSKIVSDDFDVYIHFPANYEASNKKFPVLYLVDGEGDFSQAEEYFASMMAAFHISEPIVVAITNGDSKTAALNHINRDLTPSYIADMPVSGGGPAFLGFMSYELIPYIDANYKTDAENRTLYGYGMGGLFASYVLFQKPELFKNILIDSPTLTYDNGVIFGLEKKYYASHLELNVNVLLQVPELETPVQKASFQKMVEVLKQRHYLNLNLNASVISNATHLTGKSVTMFRALSWAYIKQKEMLSGL